MASMTDIIFLLLIFFMITSTMVSPNAIKVLLPQGRQQTSAKPLTRVIIDKNLNFYTAFGNEDEMPIDLEELPAFLQRCAEKEPDMYVALYADESLFGVMATKEDGIIIWILYSPNTINYRNATWYTLGPISMIWTPTIIPLI